MSYRIMTVEQSSDKINSVTCASCWNFYIRSTTYSEYAFVAIGIQRAKGFRHIILSSVACSALQYFDMDMSNGRGVLTVRSDDLTRQIVRSYASALS
jgi:hypothetical protein